MPFTLAHPAAVLPIARGRLVASALVFGSMAPDLTYYVSLPWVDPSHTLLTRTHHFSSLVWLDPLIALALLLAFQLLLKRPLLAFLPPVAAGRVWPAAERFTWRRADGVGWILLSVVLGAATHLAWDELGELFGETWSPTVDLAGTVLGLVAILVWAWRWWQVTPSQPIPSELLLTSRLRAAVLVLLVIMPILIGTIAAVRSVEDLRASNLQDQSSIRPGYVVPQRDGMDMAEVALRTFAKKAVMVDVAVFAVYAIGWQVSRLSRGRRGSSGPRPENHATPVPDHHTGGV
jgi:hypothetical protein